MGKNTITKKGIRKKHGKENAVPELLNDSLLENILGDNINDVVGRRSEVGKRSLCLVDSEDSISDVAFNDDELEKEERRREEQERAEREKAAAARGRPTGLGIITTLSQEELDQHYSKCIEMCNRNKVNVKNAFKLQLIDYMKMIVSNRSTKSENLTLMSCTLSASAKIYGIRVDKVYTDMVKILSGKGAEIQKDESEDENGANDDDTGDGEEVATRRRRKSTNSSDEEEDKEEVNYDAMLQTEAQLNKGKIVDDDPQELPTLPRGLEYFLECRQLDPDGRFALNPSVFSPQEIEKPSTNPSILIDFPHFDGIYEKLDPCEYIKDYKIIRKCFLIMDDKDSSEDITEHMNSSLAFDPSSNIPDSIRLDLEDRDVNHVDGDEPEAWGPDYDDDEMFPEPNMSSGMKSGQVSAIQPKSFTAETMAKLVSVNAGDYSYFDNSRIDFLEGPRHWKLKRQRGGEKVQNPGEQPKKTVKKSCDLNFTAESLRDVRKYYGDRVNAVLAQKTMITWSSRRCTIPQEIAYSQKQLLSLMKNSQLLYVKKNSSTNMICNIDLKNSEEDETVLTPDDFGMDVDHDADADDDHFDDELAGPLEGDAPPPRSPMINLDEPPNDNDEELIPAPQKVNKITLKYAKAQKKIDIKRLKNTMWDCLGLESKEEKEEVKFSEVYSVLSEKLPSEDAAELSFPIAFMALLHMANEKTLSLTGNEDNSDVYVKLG